MKKPKSKAHIIAIHRDNKITYHLAETKKDEDKLIGMVIGRYTVKEYLQDEKRIQEYHKIQMGIEEK